MTNPRLYNSRVASAMVPGRGHRWLQETPFPPKGGDHHADLRRPPPFSLLIVIAVATIVIITAISALQLLGAALG